MESEAGVVVRVLLLVGRRETTRSGAAVDGVSRTEDSVGELTREGKHE